MKFKRFLLVALLVLLAVFTVSCNTDGTTSDPVDPADPDCYFLDGNGSYYLIGEFKLPPVAD